MNDEILLVLESPRYSTFERKNGAIGQKILFTDSKLYRHEIDCVDLDEFDFSSIDGKDSVTLICKCRNQKVTIKFGDVVRDTYVLVFTAVGIK